MPTFLFKTEPSEYSFSDLLRDRVCTWEGVTNAQALQGLRACSKGDAVFIYHTGSQKQIVGLAEVTRGAYADPKRDGAKLVVVDLKPVRAAPTPLSLAAIRADRRFTEFLLVRNSRLSVMPVPAPIERAIRELSGL